MDNPLLMAPIQPKETICQHELVIRAGKTNLCRVARPVRMVISLARTVRTAINTASFAGIRSDSFAAVGGWFISRRG